MLGIPSLVFRLQVRHCQDPPAVEPVRCPRRSFSCLLRGLVSARKALALCGVVLDLSGRVKTNSRSSQMVVGLSLCPKYGRLQLVSAGLTSFLRPFIPSLGRASCWLSPSSVRQWRRSDATCGTRRSTPTSTVGSRHEVSLGSAGNLATAADNWGSRVVGPALGRLLRR